MPRKIHGNFDDAANDLRKEGAEGVPTVDDLNKGTPGAHWNGRKKDGTPWEIIKETDRRVEIRW